MSNNLNTPTPEQIEQPAFDQHVEIEPTVDPIAQQIYEVSQLTRHYIALIKKLPKNLRRFSAIPLPEHFFEAGTAHISCRVSVSENGAGIWFEVGRNRGAFDRNDQKGIHTFYENLEIVGNEAQQTFGGNKDSHNSISTDETSVSARLEIPLDVKADEDCESMEMLRFFCTKFQVDPSILFHEKNIPILRNNIAEKQRTLENLIALSEWLSVHKDEVVSTILQTAETTLDIMETTQEPSIDIANLKNRATQNSSRLLLSEFENSLFTYYLENTFDPLECQKRIDHAIEQIKTQASVRVLRHNFTHATSQLMSHIVATSTVTPNPHSLKHSYVSLLHPNEKVGITFGEVGTILRWTTQGSMYFEIDPADIDGQTIYVTGDSGSAGYIPHDIFDEVMDTKTAIAMASIRTLGDGHNDIIEAQISGDIDLSSIKGGRVLHCLKPQKNHIELVTNLLPLCKEYGFIILIHEDNLLKA
ncbi:hypothetical protein COY32_02520 [candidate division WWE3 bacterium CG_4_10_14_0_2_um_filter_41_14]|uniref:Uncharacterized protein n=1 Tax=candidate division WWE3 bacterium CG_4_10_14_0_2_um_filter_41_14 TaxID=1975072 RepID=A0A2M7TJW2_UNCKA|nr:MAG: hypothetical protein COY32_02520 [candidate division WWE3 bacterium CG_4_10_14_0_2_um_filter_41_14]